MKICNDCQMEYADSDMMFCANCGKSLTDEKAETAASGSDSVSQAEQTDLEATTVYKPFFTSEDEETEEAEEAAEDRETEAAEAQAGEEANSPAAEEKSELDAGPEAELDEVAKDSQAETVSEEGVQAEAESVAPQSAQGPSQGQPNRPEDRNYQQAFPGSPHQGQAQGQGQPQQAGPRRRPRQGQPQPGQRPGPQGRQGQPNRGPQPAGRGQKQSWSGPNQYYEEYQRNQGHPEASFAEKLIGFGQANAALILVVFAALGIIPIFISVLAFIIYAVTYSSGLGFFLNGLRGNWYLIVLIAFIALVIVANKSGRKKLSITFSIEEGLGLQKK